MELTLHGGGMSVPFAYVPPGAVPFLCVSPGLKKHIGNKWLIPKGQRNWRVSKAINVAQHVVTRSLFASVMGFKPWINDRSQHWYSDHPMAPADYVSHDDAIEFCRRAAIIFQRPIRLPSELEYEYFASGGKATDFYWHDGEWNDAECYSKGLLTALFINPVDRTRATPTQAYAGSREPNQFGLYDTVGLVKEWVFGGYIAEGVYAVHPDGLPDEAEDVVFNDGEVRMSKGGTYNLNLDDVGRWRRVLRSSDVRDPGYGFRIVFDA